MNQPRLVEANQAKQLYSFRRFVIPSMDIESVPLQTQVQLSDSDSPHTHTRTHTPSVCSLVSGRRAKRVLQVGALLRLERADFATGMLQRGHRQNNLQSACRKSHAA